MKKILFGLFLFFISINCWAEDLAPNAKSAILLEPSTGKIVYQKNEHERLAPASMTKIMTLTLIMEAIDEGKIKLTDKVLITKEASSMGGSQIFLEEGSQMVVEELLKGVSIASGNDASVALAIKVGGSLDNFILMMNDKVKALGLKNTNFKNVHGLDEANHYSSAYDMAMMAQELLKHPTILNYTKIYEEYLNKPDGTRTWMVNSNKLVRFYEGIDGLKTGYTEEAGYCITATGIKNNIRFVSVVMGEETSELRSSDTIRMLNYGFNTYKINNIVNRSKNLGKIYVANGRKEYQRVVIKEDINELLKINDTVNKYQIKIYKKSLLAPIDTKQVVGKLQLINNDQVIKEVNVYLKSKVSKASIWQVYWRNISYLISGKIFSR